MAYIIKNTSGLVSTRVTDIGRQKLSQGLFKISYFQIGDCVNVYTQNNNCVFLLLGNYAKAKYKFIKIINCLMPVCITGWINLLFS